MPQIESELARTTAVRALGHGRLGPPDRGAASIVITSMPGKLREPTPAWISRA